MGLKRRKQILWNTYSYKIRQIYAVNCSEIARSRKRDENRIR